MILKIESKDQIDYHAQAFNKQALPDLQKAGPISASLLGNMKDPLKFMTSKPKLETTDMAWGSLVDLMWLTPEDWSKHTVLLPENAPKKPTVPQLNAAKPTAKAIESIDYWRAFNKKSVGKMVLTKELKAEVEQAVSMLNANPLSKYIFESSEKQVILRGESDQLHPDGQSLKAKAMMDLLPQDGQVTIDGKTLNLDTCVVDLKQCHDVSEYGMKRAIINFQYHLKTEWYLNMLRASGDEKRVNSILIFQNSSEPRDVHVRAICSEDLDKGRMSAIARISMLRIIDPNNFSNLLDTEVKVISTSFK